MGGDGSAVDEDDENSEFSGYKMPLFNNTRTQ